MQTHVTYDEREQDRKERDRATGRRSLLGTNMCQYCGSANGVTVVWDDPEDIENDAHTFEPCSMCNVEGEMPLSLELLGRDPDRSIIFTGRTRSVVTARLRAWMNANKNQIDGLTLSIHEEESYLITMRIHRGFAIDWGWGGGVLCYYPKWNQAREAFIDAARYEICQEE